MKIKNWYQKIQDNPVKLVIFYMLIAVIVAGIVIGIRLTILNTRGMNIEKSSVPAAIYQPKNLPTPDRVIYKVEGEDCYYIWKQGEVGYREILEKIDEAAIGLSKGKSITESEIQEQQNNQGWVMLDYNRISKNYLLSMENADFIKFQETGGLLLKENFLNLKDFQKQLQKETQDRQHYTMGLVENLESSNPLEQLPEEYGTMEANNGVYRMIISNIEDYHKFYQAFSISTPMYVSQEIFENYQIIATISKRKVIGVTPSVRNIKYIMSSEESTHYAVNLCKVSKVVNANCIYQEIEKKVSTQMAEEGYTTKEYLHTFDVISNQKLTENNIKELSLQKQEEDIYTKIIRSKEEMQKVGNILGIKGVGGNYWDPIEEICDLEDSKEKDYVLVLKETEGHFSVDIESVINGTERTLYQDLEVNSHELDVDGTDEHIEGSIIQVPKAAKIETVTIKRSNYKKEQFDNNKVKISKEKAIQIAKETMMEEDGYLVFPDVRSKNSSLYGYSVTNKDSFRRVWLVCNPNSKNSSSIFQVVIDSTTGEILDTDELGC